MRAVPVPIRTFMVNTTPEQHPANYCESEMDSMGAVMCSIMVLNSVMERTGNRLIEEFDLTFPQWLALGCISHAGAEGISHSQLGQRLMLSKAPITGLVDRLERAGLVIRQADARDRRVSRAISTEPGIALWWRVKLKLREHSQEIFADCLSEADRTHLLSGLGRLLSAFATHDPTLSEFTKHIPGLVPQGVPADSSERT